MFVDVVEKKLVFSFTGSGGIIPVPPDIVATLAQLLVIGNILANIHSHYRY
jgi:hypothetical protein